MTHNGNSINQPYEVIETEETVTRHFGQPHHLKYPTFSSNANRQKDSQSEQNLYEQCDPKVVLKNYQFQGLYEKFNKLRGAMSELTEKFKEINSKKRDFPEFTDADTREVTNFNPTSCCAETSLHEELKIGDHLDNAIISDCKSSVSAESQTDRMQPQLPISKRCVDDKTQRRIARRVEVPLLRKSKELLITLIDKELQRVQPSQITLSPEKSTANVPMSFGNLKHLKMECIDKISEELAALKGLEGIYGS